tara:strand:- start:765 stop:1244 length:480 start_codon:yes stop_codon:yes gene_type:complete
MINLWLGASACDAQYVFLLPNKPILPDDVDHFFLAKPDSAVLIELNGNHWRKILTIMAKLIVQNYPAWRECRDVNVFNQVGIAFSVDQLNDFKGVLFVVGNTFRDQLPASKSAQEVGVKHLAYVSYPYIWCPYLDYRQFPNILIETLREYILEKKCLTL